MKLYPLLKTKSILKSFDTLVWLLFCCSKQWLMPIIGYLCQVSNYHVTVILITLVTYGTARSLLAKSELFIDMTLGFL